MDEPASPETEDNALRVTSHSTDVTLMTQETRHADPMTALSSQLANLGEVSVQGNLTVAEHHTETQAFYKPNITIINAQKVDHVENSGFHQIADQSQEEILIDQFTFVRTSIFQQCLDFLQEHRIILLTGPAGSGKSSLARALLRCFKQQDCLPLVIKRRAEWRNYVGSQSQTQYAVLLDDIFGVEQYDPKQFHKGSALFPLMKRYAHRAGAWQQTTPHCK
ncbi:hypothetical protein ACOMHN_027829 [Nucella lapillus]